MTKDISAITPFQRGDPRAVRFPGSYCFASRLAAAVGNFKYPLPDYSVIEMKNRLPFY